MFIHILELEVKFLHVYQFVNAIKILTQEIQISMKCIKEKMLDLNKNMFAKIGQTSISTGVPQEFLKHAIPDYLLRSTDLFSFRLSNENMATASTAMAIWCERIKVIYAFFLSDGQKIYFLVSHRISVIHLCVP